MNDWNTRNDHLEKYFHFKNYTEVMSFVNEVAKIANLQNHHPQMVVDFDKVLIRTTTHDTGNKVTEKDKKLTLAIDEL